jgi:hypothetical protein
VKLSKKSVFWLIFIVTTIGLGVFNKYGLDPIYLMIPWFIYGWVTTEPLKTTKRSDNKTPKE